MLIGRGLEPLTATRVKASASYALQREVPCAHVHVVMNAVPTPRTHAPPLTLQHLSYWLEAFQTRPIAFEVLRSCVGTKATQSLQCAWPYAAKRRCGGEEGFSFGLALASLAFAFGASTKLQGVTSDLQH